MGAYPGQVRGTKERATHWCWCLALSEVRGICAEGQNLCPSLFII